jgi:hypothetical protein
MCLNLSCDETRACWSNTGQLSMGNTAQTQYYFTLKKRSPYNRPPRAKRWSRGVALLILNLGARRGWVVSTTPRPIYPRERPGTHCTGDWVGPRAGLDVCEKSRPHRDSVPDRPSRSQSLCRLSYPTHVTSSHYTAHNFSKAKSITHILTSLQNKEAEIC